LGAFLVKFAMARFALFQNISSNTLAYWIVAFQNWTRYPSRDEPSSSEATFGKLPCIKESPHWLPWKAWDQKEVRELKCLLGSNWIVEETIFYPSSKAGIPQEICTNVPGMGGCS
jgi:hypothetical protein